MKSLRTILWLVIVAALAAFSAANWEPVELTIWQDLKLDTKRPALVIAAFLLGLLPMWLIHRTTRWRLQRRITNLETTLAGSASLSSTQLEARKASEAP